MKPFRPLKGSGPGGPVLLKMTGASVVRNGRRILDNLSLEIREGEHTAILGPNGAGKSSLIRLITREDYPLAGDHGTPPLLIFGQDLWNVFDLRSRLGIISADLQFQFLNRTIPGRTRAWIRYCRVFLPATVCPRTRK